MFNNSPQLQLFVFKYVSFNHLPLIPLSSSLPLPFFLIIPFPLLLFHNIPSFHSKSPSSFSSGFFFSTTTSSITFSSMTAEADLSLNKCDLLSSKLKVTLGFVEPSLSATSLLEISSSYGIVYVTWSSLSGSSYPSTALKA